MSEEIKPYSDLWARRVDFLPLLRLQCDVGENKLELYNCILQVSDVKTRKITETKTEFGEITRSPLDVTKFHYSMGKPDPRDGIAPISQKEILTDIENNVTIDMPDVVIKTRGVVEKVKGKLGSISTLADSSSIFYQQEGYGNFTHAKRRMTGIVSLLDPLQTIKPQLISRNINPSNEQIMKLKSTLSTEWLFSDKKGYNDLGNINIIEIENTLTAGKFWTDIGIPRAFSIRYDGSKGRGRLFYLTKNKQLFML